MPRLPPLQHGANIVAGPIRDVDMADKICTECEKCGEKFETLYELGEHMEDVHGEMQKRLKPQRPKPKKKR